MFDFLEIAADLIEGWNSQSRTERWLARGCGCVLFILLCIVLVVLYLILRR